MAVTEAPLDVRQHRPGRPADPCVMVIFGAGGDLTSRKLIPALYNLAKAELLSREFAIIGTSHGKMSTDAFRQKIAEDIKRYAGGDVDQDIVEWFVKRLYYVSGEFTDKNVYVQLKDFLKKVDQDHTTHGNFFFYLATAPSFFGPIVEQLAAVGLMEDDNQHWRRVIIEKPFGHDLESAKTLNVQLLKVIKEKQIYRIDHYLGKETVQNILAFRFANGIFEPIWNRRYIDHVQISVAETVGVEQRAAFYETAGALRDMVQSHVLQLTSLVSLEPPSAFEATAVRNEKIKVLQSIRPFTPETIWRDVVRGQYGPGTIDGKPVPGYRQEPGVKPDSRTETYVALKLSVDNWRWNGVPFYLRTGKRLSRSFTEIAIQFRQAPH